MSSALIMPAVFTQQQRTVPLHYESHRLDPYHVPLALKYLEPYKVLYLQMYMYSIQIRGTIRAPPDHLLHVML